MKCSSGINIAVMISIAIGIAAVTAVFAGEHLSGRLEYQLRDAGNDVHREGGYIRSFEKHETAVSIKDDAPEHHVDLARTLMAMGRYGDAIHAYTTALRLNPHEAPNGWPKWKRKPPGPHTGDPSGTHQEAQE